jgi:nucleoside-diphosphate-sugar epimerase
MNKKIIIIGNKGCIGRALQKALKCDGVDKGESWVPHQYEVIINCAVEKFKAGGMLTSNVVLSEFLSGTANALNKKLIHFSSVSIYGKSYYGLTKRMAENIIQYVDSKDWLILRMTNVYGPGSDSPANRFQEKQNTIFGDGYNIKDHIHIKDVVKAVKLALKHNWTGVVNLSSGKPATINETFKRFYPYGRAKHLDKKSAIEVSTLDNSQALKLGWRPTWSIYDGPTD